MKKSILVLLSCLGLTGCGGFNEGDYLSLLQRHPELLKISPEPGSQLEVPLQFILEFSQRLDIQKIHPHSVAFLQGELPSALQNDHRDLMDALAENELSQVPLSYQLQGDERVLKLKPQSPLKEGLYTLLITPALASVEGVPFNSIPGESPKAFWASYGMGSQVHLLPETPSGPPPEFLMIHEVLYDGKQSESDGEAFIELYGSAESDISGFVIKLINGSNGETTDEIHIPQGTALSKTGLWVVADLKTNSSAETYVPFHDFLDHFDPQNGPDAIHLLDGTGQIWDALWYGEGAISHTPGGNPLGEGLPAPDAGPGESLSREGGIDTGDNFSDFEILTIPSPGAL